MSVPLPPVPGGVVGVVPSVPVPVPVPVSVPVPVVPVPVVPVPVSVPVVVPVLVEESVFCLLAQAGATAIAPPSRPTITRRFKKVFVIGFISTEKRMHPRLETT
jgi:signal-induced proliferation-associated 1 like protein 3